MRLIQWNCQGAFRTKQEAILDFNPDILVVSECENPDNLKLGELTPSPVDIFWYGDNPHKGIGIFAYSSLTFELLDQFSPEYRYIIPLKVKGENHEFTLFAIWAMNNKENRIARYIGQIWLAINHYYELFDNSTILLGDFNSNKIWDYKERVGNHMDLVNKLKSFNINSLYHKQNNIEHGKEMEPTFYMHRKREKPYHIDYCFASDNISEKGFSFQVGAFDDWIDKSDHTPIIIDLKLS